MRRTKLLAAFCALALLALASAASAQEGYTSESEGYTVELPSQTWKAVPRADGVHEHTDFVNGERADGYLRIRKEVVDGGVDLKDFARGQASSPAERKRSPPFGSAASPPATSTRAPASRWQAASTTSRPTPAPSTCSTSRARATSSSAYRTRPTQSPAASG